MNTVSTFQLIPPDVVRTILEYVAKLDGFRTRLRAHLPLLWVSRNFRDHLQKLDCPLSHASKGLKIVAGLPSVYSGDALESLVRTLTDVQSLSLIRKVYLEPDIMSNEPAYKGETSTIETHVRAFVKQLKRSGSSYVVYPKLHSLKFTAWEDRFIDTTQLKFPGAVPFPGLRRLTMECYYMFIDDVVLKGNAATL
ncbi:hypothetical protein IWW38_002068, partial [Coemansia aciculifera]